MPVGLVHCFCWELDLCHCRTYVCSRRPVTAVWGAVQALTYDVRKSRQREVVAFIQTGSAIRIQACVRGWLARRHFSARLAAALLLARCNPDRVGTAQHLDQGSGMNGAGGHVAQVIGSCACMAGEQRSCLLTEGFSTMARSNDGLAAAA